MKIRIEQNTLKYTRKKHTKMRNCNQKELEYYRDWRHSIQHLPLWLSLLSIINDLLLSRHSSLRQTDLHLGYVVPLRVTDKVSELNRKYGTVHLT